MAIRTRLVLPRVAEISACRNHDRRRALDRLIVARRRGHHYAIVACTKPTQRQVAGIEVIQPCVQILQSAASQIQFHFIQRARARCGAKQNLASPPGHTGGKIQQAGDGAQAGCRVALRDPARRDG